MIVRLLVQVTVTVRLSIVGTGVGDDCCCMSLLAAGTCGGSVAGVGDGSIAGADGSIVGAFDGSVIVHVMVRL